MMYKAALPRLYNLNAGPFVLVVKNIVLMKIVGGQGKSTHELSYTNRCRHQDIFYNDNDSTGSFVRKKFILTIKRGMIEIIPYWKSNILWKTNKLFANAVPILK